MCCLIAIPSVQKPKTRQPITKTTEKARERFTAHTHTREVCLDLFFLGKKEPDAHKHLRAKIETIETTRMSDIPRGDNHDDAGDGDDGIHNQYHSTDPIGLPSKTVLGCTIDVRSCICIER